MRHVRAAAALAAGTVLSGCLVLSPPFPDVGQLPRTVPPDLAPLQQPVGGPVPGATETAPQAQAEEGTAAAMPSGPVPLSLEDAIRLGLANSFYVARTDRNVEMADLRVRIARSQYWPRFDSYVYASQSERDFKSVTPFFESHDGFEPAFYTTLTGYLYMPIDLFGQIGHQVDQALLSRQDARIQQEQSVAGVIADVRRAYVEALRGGAELKAARESAEDLRALIAAARTRAPDAIPALETELAGTEAEIAALSRRNDDDYNLKRALRIPPDTAIKLTSDVPSEPPAFDEALLKSIDVSSRPEIRSAEIRVKQARLSLEQSKDYRLPTVSLNAFTNYTINGDTPTNAWENRFRGITAGVNVNVPLVLFDGGATKAQEQIAEISLRQAEADLLEFRDRARTDLQQQIAAVTDAATRTMPGGITVARAELRTAEAALLDAPRAQRPALLTRLASARAALRSAEVAAQSALYDYYGALYELERAVGANIADGYPIAGRNG